MTVGLVDRVVEWSMCYTQLHILYYVYIYISMCVCGIIGMEYETRLIRYQYVCRLVRYSHSLTLACLKHTTNYFGVEDAELSPPKPPPKSREPLDSSSPVPPFSQFIQPKLP